MTKLLCIFLGGGIGASLRYAFSVLALKIDKPMWVGTFTVNIIGCLLIGYIIGLVFVKPNLMSDNLRLGLTVGFLGGLTTFSTFSLETLNFFKDGKILAGTSYMLISCVIGLSCAAFGYWISGKM